MLVVIDGLDEAAGWEPSDLPIPLRLGKGVKVLVSARVSHETNSAAAWLRRLGWSNAVPINLPPLTREGVAEILYSVGHAISALSSDLEIVYELYRLTEGDPLLIRLYIDALRESGQLGAFVERSELALLQPGLDGYFDQWWSDQRKQWGHETPLREPAVQLILNLLSCALGPLSREDILELSEEPSKWTWLLDDAFGSVRRLVMWDAQRNGYVFSHPRLAMYFADRLSLQARKDQEARFLRYAAKSFEALGEAKENGFHVPRYVLEHFGEHLDKCDAPLAKTSKLLNERWLRSWQTLDNGNIGFLQDAERIWRRADKESNAAVQLSCALAFASVASLSSNQPPRLLRQAVNERVLTASEVLSILTRSSEPMAIANTLALIGDQISSTDRARSVDIARGIPDDAARGLALCAVAPYLDPSLKRVLAEEAIEASDSLNRWDARASLLLKILTVVDPARAKSLTDEALRVGFEAAGNSKSGTDLLAHVIGTLPRVRVKGVLAQLHQHGLDLPSSSARIHIYRVLATISPREHLREAVEVIKESGLPLLGQARYWRLLLEAVGSKWSRHVLLAEAITQGLREDEDDFYLALYYHLLPFLPRQERLPAAKRVVEALRRTDFRRIFDVDLCSSLCRTPKGVLTENDVRRAADRLRAQRFENVETPTDAPILHGIDSALAVCSF